MPKGDLLKTIETVTINKNMSVLKSLSAVDGKKALEGGFLLINATDVLLINGGGDKLLIDI